MLPKGSSTPEAALALTPPRPLSMDERLGKVKLREETSLREPKMSDKKVLHTSGGISEEKSPQEVEISPSQLRIVPPFSATGGEGMNTLFFPRESVVD